MVTTAGPIRRKNKGEWHGQLYLGRNDVGAVTICSLLQARVVIGDHDPECSCCQKIAAMHPTVRKRRVKEVR